MGWFNTREYSFAAHTNRRCSTLASVRSMATPLNKNECLLRIYDRQLSRSKNGSYAVEFEFVLIAA
jgi:hypothetical protein